MTSPIIQYRFMALDSASLANLARDYESARHDQRRRAQTFLADLRGGNWLLLLTFEALLELIQHGDDRIADQFPRLLGTLPEVAWITSRLPGQSLGGILDILHFELRAALNGASTLAQVATDARTGLFEVGHGHDIMRDVGPDLSTMRAHARERASMRQDIASLSRVDHSELLRHSVAELNRIGPRDPLVVIESMSKALWNSLHDQLSSKSAIPDPSAATNDFLSSYAIDMLCASTGFTLTPEGLLRYFGIDPELLPPDLQVGEVAVLTEFIAKARVALRDTPVPLDHRLYEVDRSLIPSWAIAEELRRKRLKTPGARASDLTDAHLAALLPYADLTEVDKRTYEYLRKITAPTAPLGQFATRLTKGPYYPTGTLHLASC